MKLGIIGRGVVGDAVYHGLAQVGNDMAHYDINDSATSINDVIECDIVFVCVPTLSTTDGNCDTSMVEQVIEQLDGLNYSGIITIKSTIIPGTTDLLSKKYFNLKICHAPEFLRQKSAHSDFFDNHDVLIIGTHQQQIADKIVQAHKFIPKSVAIVKPVEAEITKYFNNVHNAMEIVFANAMYQLCEKLGADYQEVLLAIEKRSNINISYLKCSKFYRGYQGNCLPKDMLAWKQMADKLQIDIKLFDAIIKDNERYLK
jgi:UDPglucose 6-dehydrogenase